MWRMVVAAGLAMATIPIAGTAQDLDAPGRCGTSFRGTVASCADTTRRETLADGFAPRTVDMNSYVRQGARARTLAAVDEAQERAELARRINDKLAAGECGEARTLALNHGFHGAAARIARICRAAEE